MDTFQTIKEASKGEYKERKSSFLSFAYPIQSPDEVKDLVDALKKEYYDARHHCFAWRTGIEKQEQHRAFDDREPAHTAGDMIYGVIESKQLTNILIVVVRYFGGIKLGASNLAKAYRQAAEEVVANATIIEQTLQSNIKFSFPYSIMSQVNKFIKDNALTKENYTFTSGNEILLTISQDRHQEFLSKLQSIYGIEIL